MIKIFVVMTGSGEALRALPSREMADRNIDFINKARFMDESSRSKNLHILEVDFHNDP